MTNTLQDKMTFDEFVNKLDNMWAASFGVCLSDMPDLIFLHDMYNLCGTMQEAFRYTVEIHAEDDPMFAHIVRGFSF